MKRLDGSLRLETIQQAITNKPVAVPDPSLVRVSQTEHLVPKTKEQEERDFIKALEEHIWRWK